MRSEADNKSRSAGVVFAALLAAPLLFAASPAKAHGDRTAESYEPHYHFEIKLSSDTIAENSEDTITVTANCTSAECRQLFAHQNPAYNQNAYIDVFISGGELQAGGAVLSANKRLTFTVGNTVDLPRRSNGTVTIKVTDDGLSNGDRKVTISGSPLYHSSGFSYWYSNSDAPPVVTSATLTVQDDEPPAATLALGETSINESGTGNSTTIEARLSRATTTATTITLTAPAGTSLSGTTLTIDAGDTSSADAATAGRRQVTLTAVDDTTDAPDRMVSVTGTSSLAGEPPPLIASLTIADDDDAPTVTLSLSNPSISENGGTSAVSATLSHPSSEATTVTVQAASGLYSVGSDATITIAAGDTANSSDTVSITAVNDTADEPHRSVTVTGMAQNSQGVGAVSGAALTITDDDDTPTVTLAVADPTIEESSGTASETMTTVSATLSNPSSEATTITVTAVSGAYAVGADATITIAAGETANSSDTASITAVDNDIDVGASRAVTVAGTAQNSHAVGAVSGAALTITDDDEAGLTVSKNSVATTEAAGSGRTDTFTVRLASEPTATVTVTISVTGDDTDEAAVSPGSLKFAAAANSGNNEFKWDDPQTVTVTGVDENVQDSDRRYTITVAATSDGDAIYNDNTKVPDKTLAGTNVDDDAPRVTLVLGSTSLNESGAGNSTTISARLSRASTAPTAITLTAPAGTTLSATRLTIDAGETSSADADTTAHRQVTLTAVDNTTDAPNRMVSVTGSASNAVAVADPAPVPLTIADDDNAPTVTLSLSSASISENGGTATVSATLSHPSSEATTVTVQAASGLYTVGADATITIAAGETANSSDTASIAAVNNAKDEPNRSGTVTASAQNSQGVGRVTGAPLTITDDDAAPTVTLAVTDAAIKESSGTASETMTTVSATLSNPSSEATTVTVAAVSGAYAVGADATITIAAGETANSSDTVSVTAVDNAIDDGASRIVTVTGTAQNSRGAGAVTGAPLTIADDDEAGLTVSKNSVSTTEAAGSGRTDTFTVKLDTEPTATVTVTIGVTGGDTDEAAVSPATLKFAAEANGGNNEFEWDDPRQVTVTGQDDGVSDGDRSYTITVAAASGDAIYNDNAKVPDETVSGTNADDDAPKVTLVLGGTSINESGTGNSTTVSARLSRASTAPTAITLTAPAGTSLDATRLTIDAGETSSADADTAAHRQVTLTAVDNDVDAADRMVSVTGSASNAVAVADPAAVSLTIADDDTAGLTVSKSSVSTSEPDGRDSFTVKLDTEPTATVTVTIGVTGGDTDEATVSPTTLKFAAEANSGNNEFKWDDPRQVTVTGQDDGASDGDRSYTITVAAASADANYNALSKTVSGLNADDDVPRVTLALSETEIAESGEFNSTTITAFLDRVSTAPTTITVTAPPGTTLSETRMGETLLTLDTLTIDADEFSSGSADTAAHRQLTLRAVDNGLDAPDRVVTVTGTATNSAVVSGPAGVSLTITDDDDPARLVATPASNPLRTYEGVGPPASIRVRLQSQPTAVVTLSIRSSDTGEVTVTPSTLKFAATADIRDLDDPVYDWNVPREVTVRGVDDLEDDNDQFFAITVTAASADTRYHGQSLRVGGVNLDDDDPEVKLSLSDDSISENGGTTEVSAALTEVSHQTVTITFIHAPGAYTVPSDANTITIEAGETKSTDRVTLTAVDNTTDSPDRSVTVSGISSPQAEVVGAKLTLEDDDDAPTVTLAVADNTIKENSGTASETMTTVSATLSHASSEDTTITVTPVPGAYTVGSDATITIAAGETENSSDTASITAVNNTRDEPDRSVTVTGSAANSHEAGSVTGASLTITDDDDAPTLSIDSPSVTEGDSGSKNLTFTVTLSAASDRQVTVAWAEGTGGTATSGTDYTAITGGTLTFTAGTTSQTFNVSVTGDVLDESNETVVATLSSATNATVSSTAGTGTGTITDDDATPTLSIDSPSVTEGDSGSKNLTFTVTLSAASGRQVTVDWAEGTGGTATSGTDYTAITGGTLTFAAGTTSQTFDVSVTGDTIDELNETVVVTLSSPANATVSSTAGTGTGTITDNDGAPTLSIDSPSVTEGDSGSTNLEFTVTLSAASGRQVTVDWAEGTGGTATSGADYTAITGGALTFTAGTTSQTFNVSVTGDVLDESNETVVVTLSNAGNAAISTASGTGTITDNDATPTAITLTVDDSSVGEGAGATTITVTATVDGTTRFAAATTVTVSVAGSGTATAVDFAAVADFDIEIAAGAASRAGTFTLTPTDDTEDETDETITVSGASGGLMVNPATISLTDNDGAPSLSIDSPSVTEGDSGSKNLTFTVTLSPASGQQVTVDYADAGTGTATSGMDYTAITGDTLTFAAGTTSRTFNVSVTGDVLNEVNETVVVTLSGATNATISTASGTGTGTITDNDGAPTLSIDSPSVTEGDSGSKNLEFTVTLSAASGRQVTVAWAEGTGGTATSGTDYTAIIGGTLTFTAGTTSRTFDVSVTGDVLDESNETVVVTLSGATNATISTASGTGTITDDDDAPTLSIDSPSVTEGDSGSANLTFTVTLSAASGRQATVDWAEGTGGTATSGTDYTAITGGTLTFAAGTTSRTFDVSVTGDTLAESNETVVVSLSNAANATISTATGTGTITNDDGPALSVDSPSVTERDSGSANLTFTATLSAASGQQVTVDWAEGTGGTATSGTDYTAITGGTLTFAAGTTSRAFDVSVTGDTTDEADETVVVTLSNAANAIIGTATGTGTITDDDGAPTVSIDSPSVMEGDSGSADLTFTVTLSAASGRQVTVGYADAGTGTATSGADYTAIPAGTLTFAPGTTSQTIAVTVTGDATDEANETVVVTLSAPVNATLAAAAGTGTVTNDDADLRVETTGPGTTTRTVNGHTVTMVVVDGVPAGVVVLLPVALDRDVALRFAPPAPGVPFESTRFGLGEDPDRRTVVDVTAQPVPSGGLELCLPVAASLRAEAGERGLRLLHYGEAGWAPVARSRDDAARGLVCASGVAALSPFAVGYGDLEPTFADAAVAPQRYREGTEIAPLVLPAATGGDGPLAYALAPALPEGLEYTAPADATSGGTLTGTPTVPAQAAAWTLTATDADGDTKTLTFTIEVAPDVSNLMPSFGDAQVPPQRYVQDLEIDPLVLPAATGGDGPLAYTLAPALPDGLEYTAPADARSGGTLAGTPTVPAQAAAWTLTATDADGDTATLTFTVEVAPDLAPSFGDAQVAPQRYVQDLEIDPLALPAATGGNGPLAYALAPALPEGLEYTAPTDATSGGALAGTPTVPAQAAAWTLTATDADGDTATLTFTVEVAPDLAPSFGDAQVAPQRYVQDLEIDPLVLPAATGGDGPLAYALAPAWPEGLEYTAPADATSGGTLAGTPTVPAQAAAWTLTATDADGDTATLTFTVEVLDRLRVRLKGVNEALLPDLSRAMTASTMDAVSGRIGQALSGDGAGAHGAMAPADVLTGFAGLLQANEQALEDGTWSWKQGLAGRRFALALSGDGPATGAGARVTAWGAGDYRSLSDGDGSGVDWDGHLFGAHLGMDTRFGAGGLAGLALSVSKGRFDYTDTSAEALGKTVKGEYESRMTSAHPYVGWAWPAGTHAWASLGYGRGDVTLTDGEAGRHTSDSTLRSAAAGGSVRVLSGEGPGVFGPVTVDLKGEAWTTRLAVEDNGERIAGLAVRTHRLRVAAEGARAFALGGGAAFTPSVELGMRLDGGDGETGAGVELGGGLDYAHPALGLSADVAGRVLLAHEGATEDWSVGGAVRLEPASGRGPSLRLAPSYGDTGSGLSRLWEGAGAGSGAGVTGAGTTGASPTARLDTEMGYGLAAFAGVLTPYGGLGLSEGGARGYRLGARFLLGPAFELDLEGERRESRTERAGHGLMLRGRVRW